MLVILGTFTGMYIVNTDTDHFCKLMIERRHWGISWNKDNFFLATWFGKRDVMLNVLSSQFRIVHRHPIWKQDVVAPHQILWVGDRVLIANTQHDVITIVNHKTGKCEHWRCMPKETYRGDKQLGRDVYHLNGFWQNDGKLYVTLHNKTRPSFIRVFNWPSRSLVEEYEGVGKCIHNIWKCPTLGKLLTCSSDEGVVKDMNGEIACKTGEFPRGVAIGENEFVVAASRHLFKPHNREMLTGKLHVFDNQWDSKKTYTMEGCGQLYEARVLNGRDYAHYQGSELFTADVKQKGVRWMNLKQDPKGV
jgi:hypothetical protein